METVIQIFGMCFVGLIMICIGWTIVEYIFTCIGSSGNQNKELMDNMYKFDKDKKEKI